MSLYIIQNSFGQFLDKSQQWMSGAHADAVFRTAHRDVALNQLVELNVRDCNLRARVLPCETDDRGRPRLPLSADEAAA